MTVLRSLLAAGALLAAAGLALAAEPVTVGGTTFARPDGWLAITPTSAMRKAELRTADQAPLAEVVFFQFGPGQGGGRQANIDRWLGQLRERKGEKHETVQVGGKQIDYIFAEGTFMSGIPGAGAPTPRPGYALHGAILPDAQGDIFVRMTGPVEVVRAQHEAFRKMIEGR